MNNTRNNNHITVDASVDASINDSITSTELPITVVNSTLQTPVPIH